MDYQALLGAGVSTRARRRALIKQLRELGGGEMRAFWSAFCVEAARLEREAPAADRSHWDEHERPDRYYWAAAALLGLASAGDAPLERLIGIEFVMEFRASFEAETGELLTFADGTPVEPRVTAQQIYADDGLPPALVEGWSDAFREVCASAEIVAGLDRLDLLHLVIWASITHDVDEGWPVSFSETDAITFSRRHKTVTVNVAWETATLLSGGRAQGVAMVARIVDALAARYQGLPSANEVPGLVALTEPAAGEATLG